ncbi:MAG TPA: ABC transporter substrate-binding protein [Thermoflexales bacterium]|nr:ABC transporter substrate-binding protein [Thermoflexales bacterium]
MKTEFKFRGKSIVLIAGAALLAACGGSGAAPQPTAAPSTSAPAAAKEPIPICLAIATTSNVALFGQEQAIGGRLAEKYFNDKGGVNGTPVKVIVEDTAGDEAGAINAFNACMTKDKVVGIVGPTLSQQAFAADPIADKAKVPVIGPSNTAVGIPQIGEYISRVSAPVSVVAPSVVKAALKQNPAVKRVAVAFAQNDAFSKSETVIFQKTVTETSGLELVTVQQFQTTDTDFTSQATNLMNAKPDLVIISGLAADSGNLIKQLRDLGYKGLLAGGNGLNTPNMFPVCKMACDGILVAQAYSPEADTEMNKQFVAAYTADQKKTPPQFSAQAFAGVQVFVEALKAVDAKTKLSGMSLDQIRQALNAQIITSGAKYNSPLGEIGLDKDGEILQNNVYVAQIKMDSDTAGKFVFLK